MRRLDWSVLKSRVALGFAERCFSDKQVESGSLATTHPRGFELSNAITDPRFTTSYVMAGAAEVLVFGNAVVIESA